MRPFVLSTTGVFLASGASLAASLLGVFLLSQNFGLGSETDALFTALVLPVIIGQVATGVAISMLIPAIAGLVPRGDRMQIWSICESFGLLLLIVVLGITVVLYVLAPFAISLVGPGLNEQGQQDSVGLLRAFLPLGLLTAAAGMLSSILNAWRMVVLPALANAALPLGGVVGIWTLSGDQGAASYGFGMMAGAGVAVVLLMLLVVRLEPRLTLDLRGIQPLVASAGAGIALVVLARVADNLLVALLRALASFLPPGGVTAVSYASMSALIPAFAAAALASVLIPSLVARSDNTHAFEPTLVRGVLLVTWAIGGYAAIVMGASPIIAAFALGYPGTVDSTGASHLLAVCLAAAALGAPAIGANYILATGYWAARLVRPRVALELLHVAWTAIFAVALLGLGAPGLMAAGSLGFLLLCVAGWRLFLRLKPAGAHERDVGWFLLGVTLLAGLLGAAAFTVTALAPPAATLFEFVLRVVVVGLLVGSGYLAVTALLRVPEVRLVAHAATAPFRTRS